MQLQNNLG